jgi:rare lipoprotein A
LIRRVVLLVGLAAGLAGCGLFNRKPPPPPTPAHYTLGSPYQMGGVWYYPKDQTEYDATGLTAVVSAQVGLTADGERFDSSVLAASHHTLQLPAIARVTNLENGREILVRLNDRGPADAGRLIGLTRHAADLLGARDGTQVRVQLDSEMTSGLTNQVGGGPKLDVAAAPLGVVQSQSLAPPPGVGQSSRGRTAVSRGPAVVDAAVTSTARVPDRLPDQVSQGSPRPGQIYLRASEFSRVDYARKVAAQLTGLNPDIEHTREGRSDHYRVRAGPFNSVAAADAALDQARRAGVIDSHLVVE